MVAFVDIDGVTLKYRGATGDIVALQDATLKIERGEFAAVVGPSGCGKSSLMRLVTGLHKPTAGTIAIDGKEVTGPVKMAGMAFQNANMLPWRKVIDNVLIGLPPSAREQGEKVLAQVGLADRQKDWPAKLSGGQRQRVALARALVHNPRLLLLDEPLGALDALTRLEMHRLIEGLWEKHRFTALLVTHDVQEAVALADRVILIEDGRIALDEPIALARPRWHGDPEFARIEKRILDRVLQKPERKAHVPPARGGDSVSIFGLNWAV